MVNNIFETLEQSPFIFHSISEDGILLNVSDGWLDFMGYTRNDVIGKSASDFLTEESSHKALNITIPALFETGESKNKYYQYVKKDGTLVDVLVSGVIHKNKGKRVTLCFTTDISEQKQTEKNLEKIKQSLAAAQRIAHLGNWDWNIVDDEVYWSDEAYLIYYGSRIERTPSYDVFMESVHPDDRVYVADAIEKALNREEEYNIRHRVLLPDGTIRMVKAKGEVLYDDDNKPYRMIGTVHDITTRYKNEIELEKYREDLEELVKERTKEFNETLEMYKTLARISPVGIMRTNVLGECEFVNKKWCDMTGLTKKESKGFGWMDALHPEDENRIKEVWHNAVKNKENWTLSFKLQDVEKNNIWIQCSGNVVNGGEVGHVVTFTNVTREKRILPELLDLSSRIKDDPCSTKYRGGKQ